MPALSPKNPFVANEYYFANLTTPNIYKEPTRYLIRLINYTSVIVLGLPLSLLLMFLIIRRSPGHFKAYKKLLLLETIVDLYILIHNYCLQIRSKSFNTVTMVTFMGPLASFLGFNFYCTFIFLESIAPQAMIVLLPVLYYYRFKTIKNNRPPTLLQTVGYVLIGSSLNLVTGYSTIELICPGNNPNPNGIDVSASWYTEVPIPPLLVYIQENVDVSAQLYGPLILIAYYVIALVFAKLTTRELKQRFSSFSANNHVQSVQAQLGRTLLIQSLPPLLFIIMPRLLYAIGMYFKMASADGFEFITYLSVWFPIFNMLTTIIFIVPYRRFCLRFIPCSKYFRKKNTVVVFNFNSSQITAINQPTLNQPTSNGLQVLRIN